MDLLEPPLSKGLRGLYLPGKGYGVKIGTLRDLTPGSTPYHIDLKSRCLDTLLFKHIKIRNLHTVKQCRRYVFDYV